MKKLRARTVISQDLYVERSADRQVRKILDDMGRPGYVLVARQMGKTNLLLNARRTLASHDIIFVYVDLSENFTNISDYYSLLTRTMMEQGNFQFEITAEMSRLIDLPSQNHNTFDRALRLLLQQFTGKVVFILDEVDSIASYDFGAKIFSHIRSLYFAGRANYPEFERVTYLLSGVAEPADLIKDKNVSPFNIGEKIYLTDFSLLEFNTFLDKACLQMSSDVSASVFEWSGGNPRMTWDICSEIEDLILAGNQPAVSDVYAVIKKIYLDSFDRAPVDHIRLLAQNDREIREALISLRSGNTSDVSSKARSRMYLAGITGSPEDGKELRIKNRVLEEALSTQWLDEINKQARGLLRLARENQEEGRHDTALALYEEFLRDNSVSSTSVDAYRIGIAYYNVRRYDKAISWFEPYIANEDLHIDTILPVAYSLVIAHTVESNHQKAIEYCRLILGAKNPKKLYPGAASRLGTLLLEQDGGDYLDEAEQLSNDTLDWLQVNDASKDVIVDARVRAKTNLGIVAERRGHASNALRYFEDALPESVGLLKTYILLRIGTHTPSRDARLALSKEVYSSVRESLMLGENEYSAGLFTTILIPTLTILREFNLNAEFEEIVELAQHTGFIKHLSRPHLAFQLWGYAYSSNPALANTFLEDIVVEQVSNPQETVLILTAARLLLSANPNEANQEKYLTAFDHAGDDVRLETSDYIAITQRLLAISRDPSADLDERLIRLIDRMHRLTQEENAINCALLRRFVFKIHQNHRRVEQAHSEALKLKNLLDKYPRMETSIFNAEMKEAMIEGLDQYFKAYRSRRFGITSGSIFAKNKRVKVLYNNGHIVNDKYGNLERDIQNGICIVVG